MKPALTLTQALTLTKVPLKWFTINFLYSASYLLATTSAHYRSLCTCRSKESCEISSFSIRWKWRWLSPVKWHLVCWYSKTCLKRNTIVPGFFSVLTGFRFTKGCVLIKQSTKNMIA